MVPRLTPALLISKCTCRLPGCLAASALCPEQDEQAQGPAAASKALPSSARWPPTPRDCRDPVLRSHRMSLQFFPSNMPHAAASRRPLPAASHSHSVPLGAVAVSLMGLSELQRLLQGDRGSLALAVPENRLEQFPLLPAEQRPQPSPSGSSHPYFHLLSLWHLTKTLWFFLTR